MNTIWKIVGVLMLIIMVTFIWKLIIQDGTSTRTITKGYVIKERNIEKTVYSTGVLISSERVEIVSKIVGNLSEIKVEEGKEVEKDQILAVIENTEIDNEITIQNALVEKLKKEVDELNKDLDKQKEVMSAKLALDLAEIELETAKKEHNIEEEKIKRGTPSKSTDEMEKLERDIEAKTKKVEIAKLKYEDAIPTEAEKNEAAGKYEKEKEKLSKLQEAADGRSVTSPISGTVLKIFIDKEKIKIEKEKEYKAGTPLFVVADLSSMIVKGKVFESDLNKLIKGQPVRVYLDPQEKTYQKARLEKISMTPGDDLGRFNIRIEFDSPPKDITEGVRVDFRVIVDSRENAIAVPIEFVRKEKGRYYVVVMQGEENVEREVKLGLADDHIYEVLDGLEKGEKVILKIESDK